MKTLRMCLALLILGSIGTGVAALGSVRTKHVDSADTNFRLCALLYFGATSAR